MEKDEIVSVFAYILEQTSRSADTKYCADTQYALQSLFSYAFQLLNNDNELFSIRQI